MTDDEKWIRKWNWGLGGLNAVILLVLLGMLVGCSTEPVYDDEVEPSILIFSEEVRPPGGFTAMIERGEDNGDDAGTEITEEKAEENP